MTALNDALEAALARMDTARSKAPGKDHYSLAHIMSCIPEDYDTLRAAVLRPSFPDAETVLTEYVRICIAEHEDDAPKSARVDAMQRALKAALTKEPK